MATTDATGAQTATFTYDPFGAPTNPTNPSNPDNTATGSTYGWVGQYEKLNETAFTLAPTQMGARVYLATLGRFLSVDPVEGGVDNNYVYPSDPVNDFDLTGQCVGPLLVICIAAATTAVSALFIAQASKTYQDNPTTSNFVWAGVSMAPGIGAAGSASRAGLSATRSFARKLNPLSGDEFGVAGGRFKPFGNWKAKNKDSSPNWAAIRPHYHRRITDQRGRVKPGGSINQHRPWQGGW